MSQVTKAFCEQMLVHAARKEHAPLTIWEEEQLARAWLRLESLAKSPAAQGAVDETHDYARAVAYAKKIGLPTDFPPIPRPAPAGERDALVSDAYTDATFKAVWIDPAMGTTLDDNDSEHIASAALETPASLPAIPAAPAAPNATPRTDAYKGRTEFDKILYLSIVILRAEYTGLIPRETLLDCREKIQQSNDRAHIAQGRGE